MKIGDIKLEKENLKLSLKMLDDKKIELEKIESDLEKEKFKIEEKRRKRLGKK